MSQIKQTAIAAGVALAVGSTALQASHFRGGALIPSVDANGLLTIASTTFWRPTSVSNAFANVSGLGNATQQSNTLDTTDSRYTVRNQVFTIQLPSAGTYDISYGSCCRVGGVRNWVDNGLGTSSTSWTMNSTIVWDGSTANNPIQFSFNNIQPNVLRGAAYSDNLGAVSPTGHTLSYDQVSNLPAGVPHPPGYAVDPNTGAITIPAVDTTNYNDNTTGNIGADYAFSGNINSSDGSSVEFEWLFDATNTASNQPPDVQDIVINALVGDMIGGTMVASDDGLPTPGLTWDLLSFLGPAANLPFTFNPADQTFSWDTTGSGVGTYVASIRAADNGGLTDVGTVTINLTTGGGGPGPNPGVPVPGPLALIGVGLLGLGAARWKKK